jgi:uncharacterized membrane protein
LVLAGSLVLAAAAFAVKTVLPDERSIVTPAVTTGAQHAASRTAWLPALALKAAVPAMDRRQDRLDAALGMLLLLSLVLGLTTRAALALALLAAVLAFDIWSALGYPQALRHQGILLVFALVLYWLNAEAARSDPKPIAARLHSLALLVSLPLVLLWNDALAFRKIRRDLAQQLSSSESLGAFLKGRPELRNAILVAEPDYLLEALPYYASQRIYIPRESRFGNWVRFTTESRATMSFAELMATGATLRETHQAPVLIALGLEAQVLLRQRSASYSYNKVLRWTPEERRQFARTTSLVASFRSATGDENFDLYRVLP